MKVARTFGNRFANKTDPRMMQPLESRRLMSLTAAFDAAPISPPPVPVQINHSFGFEQQLQNPGGQLPPPPPSAPSMAGPIDSDSLDARFASAIAQGTPVILTSPTIADAEKFAPQAGKLATLSALYSSIGISTVAEIDNANFASSTQAIITTLYNAALDFNAPDSSGAPAGSAPIATAAKTTEIMLPYIAQNSQPTASFGSQNGLVHIAPQIREHASAAGLISHEMLQSVEQELIAVTAHSRGLAWNMGRDRAIELAHAQSPEAEEMSVSSLTRWQSSAAVIGAAVAGVVYAQHEILGDKRKMDSVFSDRLIKHLPR